MNLKYIHINMIRVVSKECPGLVGSSLKRRKYFLIKIFLPEEKLNIIEYVSMQSLKERV